MKGGEKMNKLLLLVVAVIVIAGAFLLFGNKKSTQQTITQPTQPSVNVTEPAVSQDEPQVITLTSTGFAPKDITVKQGSRVIWKNESGKTATVHSADHPTHRLFPVLNLGEFNSDTSLQAVLDEKGIFKYHNHIDASANGTITVE